jgi:hypothetical protein
MRFLTLTEQVIENYLLKVLFPIIRIVKKDYIQILKNEK